MSTIKVAIVGASGETGQSIVNALLDSLLTIFVSYKPLTVSLF